MQKINKLAQFKQLILSIVMCRWYMVGMIIPLPILMHEDTMVEMLFTKIWLFTFGCSIVIYYFNRNNGT